MSISTQDLGTSWASGSNSGSASVAIEVGSPIVVVPATQWANLNGYLTFSSFSGNLITVSDPVSSSIVLNVDLSVTTGTVAMMSTGGLTIVSGNPNGDSNIDFTGTASSIDADLNWMTFDPPAGYSGAATLTVEVSDQGDGEIYAPQTATGQVGILVGARP